MATPGSSPSVCVTTTPASSALALRRGPSSESSSAFTRTTCLPCLNAASARWAADSIVPVTSTIRSMEWHAANTRESSVNTGIPRSIADSASRTDPTHCHPVIPASLKARSPCPGVRLAIATKRIPGTGVASCSAMARPVAPAPTIPTRIGRRDASRSCRAVSNITRSSYDLAGPRPWESLQHQFATEESLGITAESVAFHTPQSHEREKCLRLKPLLGALGLEGVHDQVDLFFADFGGERHENARLPHVAIIFGNFVFQNHMVAKSIPGQFCQHAVVLVSIVAIMGED